MTSLLRVHPVVDREARGEGDHVLYWMTDARRTRWSWALQRAVDHARALRKPLVVLEAVRCGAQWSSRRFHRFILDGMVDNARAFDAAGVTYHPYVEPTDGHGKGLLAALAKDAAVVVTDLPGFWFGPHMLHAAARQLEALDVRLEAIDGAGIIPVAQPQRAFTRAASFRLHLHRNLHWLDDMPEATPLARYEGPRYRIPRAITERWPAANPTTIDLRTLPIDQSISFALYRGGSASAGVRWKHFLRARLSGYAEGRNHPDADATTGLSPWLHFGHVGAHELVHTLLSHERWDPELIDRGKAGKREGFWGVSPNAESLLDELITWRELGYCESWRDPEGFTSYKGVPEWARKTLADHADDPREHLYTHEQLALGQTHDELWNAAQRELVHTGRIHNYLRMLWGKRVLEWTRTPEEAFDILVDLNNRYALDGRDPSSYNGIGWVFGRFDRAWGPERPIYGKVRYMSSARTRQKLKLTHWLKQWGDGPLNQKRASEAA